MKVRFERAGLACPVLTPKQIKLGLRRGRYRFTSLGLERLCSRCGEYWPLDSEFWHHQPTSATGVNGYCNACHAEFKRQRKKQEHHYGLA